MAYQRPLVLVYQEYAKLTQSTTSTGLYPVIIGPCFHIVDPNDVTDEPLSFSGNFVKAGVVDIDLPHQYPGAVVDTASVSVRISDATVDLFDVTKAVASTALNELTFARTSSYPTGIEVGDLVDVYETVASVRTIKLTGARVVDLSKAETYKVGISQTLPTMAGTVDVVFRRKVSDFTTNFASTGPLTVNVSTNKFSLAALTRTIKFNGADVAKSVATGKMYVGYKALRQDLSDIKTVSSIDEAKGAFGKLVPENPLGFGVSITLANTTVNVRAIGVDSENLVGYTAAKDRLETVDDIYAIVPLTQDTAILNMFKAHAEQLSVPDKAQWRCVLANTPLVVKKVMASGTGTVLADSDTKVTLLRMANATFISSGVDAGHVITIENPTTHVMVEYVVRDAPAEDLVRVVASKDFTTGGLTTGQAYAFTITNTLDKSAQATNIARTSKSFGYSRFIHVWPDVVVIGGRELPGYYLACTVAGMTGGLAPHQGFTRLSVAGIEGIKHSNEYFNQTQLDAIADGGTFIFVQDNPTAAPYVRHQLTTDMSALEFKEFSFVKNFDYVSILCRDTLDRFLGKYNINKPTLGTLETAIRAVLESLKLYNLPKIGSPVLGYDVLSVIQHDTIRDRVEMKVEIDFPYALNTIGLHLISR